MNYHDLKQIPDDDIIQISGRDLHAIYTLAYQLASGGSPKGNACFHWGKVLHRIVEMAEPAEPLPITIQMSEEAWGQIPAHAWAQAVSEITDPGFGTVFKHLLRNRAAQIAGLTG